MPTATQWSAFLLASILFIQVPGPSLLFTIGRALTAGRRLALVSVIGNATGLLVQVAAVAAGLGAIVSVSSTVYTAVKVIGALYVMWLGVQAIRHRADARLALSESGISRPTGTASHALRIGITVGVTNPKTLVFFAAFLPQFTDPSSAAGPQLVVLGVVFAALAICSDSIWAVVAGRAREWFGRDPRRLDKLSVGGGASMLVLGGYLLAAE